MRHKKLLFLFTIIIMSLLSSCLTWTNALDESSKIAKKRDLPIYINQILVSEPNSADGVTFYLSWKNISGKELKYVVFKVEPYNAVNDIVSCEITGNTTCRGAITGPIKIDEFCRMGCWENAWYNNTIKYIKVIGIEVTFMDNTLRTYDVNEVNLMIAPKDIRFYKDNGCQ